MSFDAAYSHVLGIETDRYTNTPGDAGGPTKFGITLATLAGFRGHPVTAEDVASLEEGEAKAIYKANYWDSMGLQAITSAKVATILFDQGVNRGPRVAVRALQTVLETIFDAHLGVDGTLGEETARKANSVPEAQLVTELVIAAQWGYLDLWRANPSQGAFLRGWMARTWRLLRL